MNEMANIAERVGADIEMVRHGIGSDPRIGYSFIYPGAGYGGSCFPKDVQALEKTAKQYGYTAQILEAVEAVNARQKHKVFELASRHFDGSLSGKTFAVWGLAFKPNTDDMPRSILTEKIARRGFHIHREYGADPMERIAVSELMTASVVVIEADCTLGEVVSEFFGSSQSHRAYPVVAQGRYLGMLDREMLANSRGRHDETVATLMGESTPLVALPQETARLVAARMPTWSSLIPCVPAGPALRSGAGAFPASRPGTPAPKVRPWRRSGAGPSR